MLPYNQLPNKRIYSLDILRGLDILLMVFVNEVDGVRNLPAWLHHMPRQADAMTIVDWVFPGFLFIMGMSIPVALNRRIERGDTFFQLQRHILFRTLGLLVLGVLMVNAEGGYSEANMPISMALWSLLIYPFAILVWNVYSFKNKTWTNLLRGVGVIGLLWLAIIYRGGASGTEYITPRWWGILGLIGWAYLYACIFYQLFKGNKLYLGLAVAFCALVYVCANTSVSDTYTLLAWTHSQAGNATHTGIALCGMILTLIFFDQSSTATSRRRLNQAMIFAAILFVAGYLLRGPFEISKIRATPSWGLYSSVFGIFAFVVLYWLADLKGHNRWAQFLQPAAQNPLLTYIIPFIMWALYDLFDFYPVPDAYMIGFVGVAYCLFYAFAVVWVVKWLNKIHIRLQL